MIDPKALEELDLASRAIERARALLAGEGHASDATIGKTIVDAHAYLEEHNAGTAPNGRTLAYARAIVTLVARSQSSPSPAVRDVTLREGLGWNYDMKKVPMDGSHFVVLCTRMDEPPIAWKPYKLPDAAALSPLSPPEGGKP